MSAIEAMAYGVPTIVPDVQGLHDFGKFISSDIESMGDNIISLFMSSSRWEKEYLRVDGYRDENGFTPWESYRRQLRTAALQKFSDATTIPKIKEMLQ